MKAFFIAANWKMHPIPEGALAAGSPFRPQEGIDIAVFPTFLDLQACIEAGLTVGAQYGHPEAKGAHTGDVSMAMLKERGCTYVLCGHSERRKEHHETDDDVAAQVKSALECGLHPILCVGETAEEREAGQAEEVVGRQLDAVRSTCAMNNEKLIMKNEKVALSIAYEPVWAIGTGNTATPEQAQEMHAFIRNTLFIFHYSLFILYGGSMNPSNVEALLRQPDIDGGLIGGASLSSKDFGEIVKIAQKINKSA